MTVWGSMSVNLKVVETKSHVAGYGWGFFTRALVVMSEIVVRSAA